jgi:hypothetical protein
MNAPIIVHHQLDFAKKKSATLASSRGDGDVGGVGARHRVDVRNYPDRRICSTDSTPCSLSRTSGCRDRGLYPLSRPRAERHLLPLLPAPIPF